ncbi:alpha/beta hydrolase [Oricola sp.]|uniref:alpha/beta hydrolase n=1 Tax=Oricola sp. TaxID=1979950 RepID=UPI003BAD265C
MHKRTLLIPAAALALAATLTPLSAAETEVTFEVAGQTVVGTLETPAGDAAPVVLLLHGFTGSRDELPVKDTEEGVFSRTARLLAEAGYASLRIDFRGSGESGGEWADTTFSGQVTDAVAAIDWLKENPEVDGSNIAIVGWSQGGLVAGHAAEERPEVKSVTLWAPVVNPMQTYIGILGAENVTAALASDADTPITATLPWGPETVLNAAFYHEFAVTSTAAALAGYDGPLQVIVGSKDTVVAPQPASGQLLIDYHDGKERLVVFETDHVWDAFSGPATLDEKMVPTTLEWIGMFD